MRSRLDEKWDIGARTASLNENDLSRLDGRWMLDDRSTDSASFSGGSVSSKTASTEGSYALPKSNMLVSSRWDLSKFKEPELRWSFYDAYHRCKPVKTARKEAVLAEAGFTSVEGENLDKVFKRSILQGGKSALDAFLEATEEKGGSPYPPPFDRLIPLQDREGKWHDLCAVLCILDLPKSYSLARATEWEQATAFAIATIRQRLDLFELLRDSHDAARQWMGTGEFIYQARELILMTQLTRTMAHGKALDEAELLETTSAGMISDGDRDIQHEVARRLVEDDLDRKYGEKVFVSEPPVDTNSAESIGSFFLPRPKTTTISFLKTTLADATTGVNDVALSETCGSQQLLTECRGLVSNGGASELQSAIVESSKIESSSSVPTRRNSRPLSSLQLRKSVSFATTEASRPDSIADFEETKHNRENSVVPLCLAPLEIADQGFDQGFVEKIRASSSQKSHTPHTGISFDSLKGKLTAISPQKDLSHILKIKRDIEVLQLRLINEAVAIDIHVDSMHCVLLESVQHFNSCLLYEERNTSFMQLTAMLGDDCPPREGFTDWRGNGVAGLRPLVLAFFDSLHALALLRLMIEELESPEGRKVTTGPDMPYDENRYRWRFMYNGVDVVLKVMHCCDFLRRCKEICNNYGRMFSFTCNPLMLPFSLREAWESIPELPDKVKEQLETRAHVRPLYSFTGDVGGGYRAVSVVTGTEGAEKWAAANANNWRLDKYIGRFSKTVIELCARRGFNWPNAPIQQLKDAQYARQMYTAILVIFIRQKDSVASSFVWERSFVQLASTERGKNIMIGKTGLKKEKSLDLPSEVIFRAKNALLGIYPNGKPLEFFEDDLYAPEAPPPAPKVKLRPTQLTKLIYQAKATAEVDVVAARDIDEKAKSQVLNMYSAGDVVGLGIAKHKAGEAASVLEKSLTRLEKAAARVFELEKNVVKAKRGIKTFEPWGRVPTVSLRDKPFVRIVANCGVDGASNPSTNIGGGSL